jgi:hypothetical protein
MPLRQPAQMTAAKVEANHQNAQQSTGPRTPQGKAQTRLNALQHGHFASPACWSAESLRALGEDPQEFQELCDELETSPGPIDDQLCRLQLADLAKLQWQRRRVERAWEAWARRQRETAGEEAVLLLPLSPEGEKLLRQMDVIDRALDRKTRLVLRLRDAEEREERRRERREAREEALDEVRLLGDSDDWPEDPDARPQPARPKTALEVFEDLLPLHRPKTAEQSQKVVEKTVESPKSKVESGKAVESPELRVEGMKTKTA